MSQLVARWNSFWFLPTPTSTLAVVRIAYGAVLLAWAGSQAWDVPAFFSSSGLLPERSPSAWTWTLLDVEFSETALQALLMVLVLAATALLLGFYTRAAAVLAFILLHSFQYRNLFVVNSGDTLLRVLSFYLMFAPAGAALSIDRWRNHRRRFWEFPKRAPWALRLMQLQLSALYLFTVWEKVQGETWNDGTAISYALRLDSFVRLWAPSWILESLPIINLMTFGTLALELALAFLVWNRWARPWVLALGVAMHLMIEATIEVGFFGFAIFVVYLAFVPADTMSTLLLRLRARLGRSNVALLRRVGSAGCEPMPPPAEPVRPEVPTPAETA